MRRVGPYGSRSSETLREEYSLGLNDKEIEELMNIPNHAVEPLARNCVVSTRTQLGG